MQSPRLVQVQYTVLGKFRFNVIFFASCRFWEWNTILIIFPTESGMNKCGVYTYNVPSQCRKLIFPVEDWPNQICRLVSSTKKECCTLKSFHPKAFGLLLSFLLANISSKRVRQLDACFSFVQTHSTIRPFSGLSGIRITVPCA